MDSTWVTSCLTVDGQLPLSVAICLSSHSEAWSGLISKICLAPPLR